MPTTFDSFAEPDLARALKTRRAPPRLFAAGEDFQRLRRADDPVTRALKQTILDAAEGFAGAPPVGYEKTGRRLLDVSRCCLERAGILAMAWRLTGDPRHAARAEREILAAAAFPDWNPGHFLDAAEMTLALAVACDWLTPGLSEDALEAGLAAIVEKGLRPSETGRPWWIAANNNWNQVCHAGMVAGAIAAMDREPELARRMIRRALLNLPAAARHSYEPDGAYPEGPMYWAYGTSFHLILVSALESTFGSTFGTDAYNGFLNSAEYLRQMTGPTGDYFAYADSGLRRPFLPAMFWFAARLGDVGLIEHELRLLRDEPHGIMDRLLPFALLWWDPRLLQRDPAPAPLSWMGGGPNPVSAHRSGWNDPSAAYVAIKGGSPAVNHGHMDVGGFVLDADGVRWADDPGMQEYESLERENFNLWDRSQDGKRWEIFRLGAGGHNILQFDGAAQRVEGTGRILRFHGTGDRRFSVIDLSEPYADRVERCLRGVWLLPDRRVFFQDEWTLAQNHGGPVEITWQMLTRADVNVRGREAILRRDGCSLRLRVLTPEACHIEIVDVSTPPHPLDDRNPNTRKVVVRLASPPDAGRLQIVAEPGTSACDSPLPDAPLEQWTG